MELSMQNLCIALLVAIFCTAYSKEAVHSSGLESSADAISSSHAAQKRSAGQSPEDSLLLTADESFPYPGLDKRSTLFRFGKRQGSLLRFGKRQGFGKRQDGTLFRFGRSNGLPSSAYGDDSLYAREMAKRTLFRFGKRSALEDYAYPSEYYSADDLPSKRDVNGFHWGSDE